MWSFLNKKEESKIIKVNYLVRFTYNNTKPINWPIHLEFDPKDETYFHHPSRTKYERIQKQIFEDFSILKGVDDIKKLEILNVSII